MSKKICTFYGMREVIDASFKKKIKNCIKNIIEENDSVEFQFLVHGESYYIFLKEILSLKSQYSEKSIEIKIIVNGCYMTPDTNARELKGLYGPFSFEVFDDIICAEAFLSGGSNNANTFMGQFHRTVDWYLNNCDIIILYHYPQLRTSETFHAIRILKKKNKEFIFLTSNQTINKILRCIESLNEPERIIMKKIANGCMPAAVAKEMNFSTSYISARAEKASMKIIAQLTIKRIQPPEPKKHF